MGECALNEMPTEKKYIVDVRNRVVSKSHGQH